MVDRKKVIKGLETCSTGHCEVACPYYNTSQCTRIILTDALELLKEQEPIEAKTMGESKSHGSWWFACGACGHAIDIEDNFCRECGRKVMWDA